MIGRVAIVLHAHLPYVVHPEHDRHLEETWLHEVVAECYLPLLRVLHGWERDGVDWRLSLGVTPTLGAMMDDPLCRARTRRYVGERLELARSEILRNTLLPTMAAVARFYADFHVANLATWDSLSGDIPAALRALAGTGRLELLASSATHAVLPLLLAEPGSLRAQIEIGLRVHRRRFGLKPEAFWLPECAWSPPLGRALVDAGVRRVVVETHGITGARPSPSSSVFAPVRTPEGLAAFGRDPSSARQVWSREAGYPGDPRYREFHADLSGEAEWEYIRPYLPAAEGRPHSGLKCRRITGRGPDKEVYDREAALRAAAEHAAHFLAGRAERCARAGELLGGVPTIVAPYDAELFGHWWFEGPEFLDAVMRGMAGAGLRAETLGGCEGAAEPLAAATPAESTWGEGGHLAVWLDPSNARMQPELRRAGARMTALAELALAPGATEAVRTAAVRAARELLLAQSSDWPFLVRSGPARAYADARFDGHISAFRAFAETASGNPQPGAAQRPVPDTVLPGIDLAWWLPGCRGSR